MNIPLLLCRSRKDEYLKELTRDNIQLLINKLWQVCKEEMWFITYANLCAIPFYQLPVEKTDGMVLVEVSEALQPEHHVCRHCV